LDALGIHRHAAIMWVTPLVFDSTGYGLLTEI